MVLYSYDIQYKVRMAEWSKALRSGRSPLLWAWVRIPLLTNIFPPIIVLVLVSQSHWYSMFLPQPNY